MTRDFLQLRAIRMSRASRAFTLLEVLLAVVILSFTAFGVYRFVQANIKAIALSVEDAQDQLSLERLVQLVQEELYNIAPRTSGAVLGQGLKKGGINYDYLEWRSRGGPGLMTTAVTGEYRVQLRIQPVEKTSEYEIGLWRSPAITDAAGTVIQSANSDKDATWVPLLPHAKSLTVRYWDARIGQQVVEWRDLQVRPGFVILVIERDDDSPPVEAWLPVPVAQVQQ